MPGLKDIKRRIRSVHNTKKITYAMKLVSSAKLKKAQIAVTEARAYTNALAELLGALGESLSRDQLSHPLMQSHSAVKNVRLLIIGGGRGLCGSYNTNLNKRVEAAYKELTDKYPEAEISATLIGKKVGEYFRRVKRPFVKSYEEDLDENAALWPIDEICRELEQAYLNGSLDEVYVVFTRFKSAISIKPRVDKLLPLDPESFAAELEKEAGEGPIEHSGDMLFEPSPAQVFEALIPRILRTVVRQAGLDAKASEHGSRMVAMEAATNNAGDLLHALTLKHNKLRQSAITSELLDIIGGAEAVE